MRLFAASYRDWTVKITKSGSAVVFDAQKNPVFLVKRSKKPESTGERRTFGREVLAHLFDHGIVSTMKKYNVHLAPKVGQVVDHAIDDMQGFEDKYMHDSVLEDRDDDMSGDPRGTPPGQVGGGEGYSDDMDSDVRGTPPGGVIEDGTVDHELGLDQQSYESLSTVDEQEDDMKDKVRKPFSVGQDSALDDEVHDHKEKLASLGVGQKIAQKGPGGKAGRPWVIARKQVSKDGKKVLFTVRRGKKLHKVAADDLLQKWLLLDKAPATIKMPGHPVQAMDKCAKCGMSSDKCACDKAADAPSDDGMDYAAQKQAFEARLRKRYEAKIASLQKQHEQRVAEQEKSFVERLARAMFFVDARQRMNVEASQLKEAMVRILANTREVGKDAATGAPLVYEAMDLDLANHLVEAAFQEDDGGHVESLINRAAEVMNYGDEYLLSAEKDLQNLQPAARSVSAAWQLGNGEPGGEADDLRRQANQGNPVINPAPAPDVGNGHSGARSAIRSALGGTKVESARGLLRN
jgi:hypothetical protein